MYIVTHRNAIAIKEIDPEINPPNAAVIYPFRCFISSVSSATFLWILVLNMPAIKNNCMKNNENDATSVNIIIGRKIIVTMDTYIYKSFATFRTC